MSEAVLVLPLLFVILSMLFYFGRGFVRLQQATVMNRYETWRQATEAPTPNPASANGAGGALNKTFFGGNASSIRVTANDNFPTDARDALRRDVAAISRDGGDYTNQLLDKLPKGRTLHSSTNHTETGFWRQWAGPIKRTDTRIGNDWRFVNGWQKNSDGKWTPTDPKVGNTKVLRDTFFRDFDQILRQQANRDIGLADTIRSFYLHLPPYKGPKLPDSWTAP